MWDCLVDVSNDPLDIIYQHIFVTSIMWNRGFQIIKSHTGFIIVIVDNSTVNLMSRLASILFEQK